VIADENENNEEFACQPIDEFYQQSERYRVFIENAADGFYETNLNGDIKFCNNAFCRILGNTQQEILNLNYLELMDAENARSLESTIKQLNAPETQFAQATWKIIRKDGKERILDVSAQLIYSTTGQKIGYRGMARDVTNKHRAQAAAIASEKKIKKLYNVSQQAQQRYRAFLRFLPIPVMVQSLDYSVMYINPAFEKTFGWSLDDLKDDPTCFIPAHQIPKTRTGKLDLLKNGMLYGLETKRISKDGQVLNIIYDGAAIYNTNNEHAGLVVTMRDITQSKRDEQTTQILFRIAEALHRYRDLNKLLAFITREIKILMDVGRTHVLLLDREQKEFFFRAGAYDDPKFTDMYSELRISVDKGAAGHVYRTGKPIIVNDYQNTYATDFPSDLYPDDGKWNVLQVPLWVETEMIGVLCVVNKKEGDFVQADQELLSTVAGMVALPIENARINMELQNSYDEVKSLNRTKDRVIDHLSHELKTPASVLSVSMDLLIKNCENGDQSSVSRIVERCQRNLSRILDMQYELADIMRQQDERSDKMLSLLLDVCSDELESVAEAEIGESAANRVRKKINQVFGPSTAEPKTFLPGPQVARQLKANQPDFTHRQIKFITNIENTDPIRIPPEVLDKIVTGLVQNAIEYTPDGGCVSVTVENTAKGPALIVEDTGVGITAENQRLLFENYFTTAEPLQYSTRSPYDFNAGGRGFNLLRLKIFSERYQFKLLLDSHRCPHIPTEADTCPGQIADCRFCKKSDDCRVFGGTRFTILFSPAIFNAA
jgi:PAS domain S-box-containing protein